MSHTSIHTRQPSDFNVTPGRRDSDDHLGHDIATAIFQDEWSENISLHTMQSHEAPTNAANGTSHDKDDPRTKPGAIKPKNNPTQLKLRWHGGWLTEIISLVAAWCIMVAVIAILYHYRGKQLSETPTRPSLNTIINILSTAFTALVTLATTAGETIFFRHTGASNLVHSFESVKMGPIPSITAPKRFAKDRCGDSRAPRCPCCNFQPKTGVCVPYCCLVDRSKID